MYLCDVVMIVCVLIIIIHSCVRVRARVRIKERALGIWKCSLALPPAPLSLSEMVIRIAERRVLSVSFKHLRAPDTVLEVVRRLSLGKKKRITKQNNSG